VLHCDGSGALVCVASSEIECTASPINKIPDLVNTRVQGLQAPYDPAVPEEEQSRRRSKLGELMKMDKTAKKARLEREEALPAQQRPHLSL